MRICKVMIFLFVIFNYSIASPFLKGSGSTLSEPAYYSWAYYFHKEKDIVLYYESIGSFSGLKKLKFNSIDFASSDKSMDEEYLVKNDLIQFPTLETSINIVHNIKDIESNSLKLTNEIISKIFKKEIEYWDDISIVNLNKDIKLPHKNIVVVLRKGDSGTTYYFTKYLYETTHKWKEIGTTKNLELPNVIYGKNNQEISSRIEDLPYSIGYLPAPYAIANKLPSIVIQNRKGEWKNFSETDYPIKILNYTLAPKKLIKENKEFIKFFNWVFKDGDKYIKELGFTPLDDSLKKEYFDLFTH